MTRRILSTTVVLALLTMGAASAVADGPTVTLNGGVVPVRWSDGDSFRIQGGEYEGASARLGGYNSLESYGPVHRWGEWTASELAQNARDAKTTAMSGSWTCTTTGERDHYDRVLVTCADLIEAMVSAGHGHLFALDGPADPAHVAAQLAAQEAGAGMWQKGVPEGIVTSLHSAAEGRDHTYNRVISSADGSSTQVSHEETYAVCQEVCLQGSCLVYVPFANRYGGDRAECLR